MPTPVDRNALALSMITSLPSWGTWASSMREVDTPFGKIGYRQASIMWILRHHQVAADNQSTTGLAAHLGIQNSVVTRSCERLEQLGLVERTTDEHDRRRSHVELTSTKTDGIFVARRDPLGGEPAGMHDAPADLTHMSSAAGMIGMAVREKEVADIARRDSIFCQHSIHPRAVTAGAGIEHQPSIIGSDDEYVAIKRVGEIKSATATHYQMQFPINPHRPRSLFSTGY